MALNKNNQQAADSEAAVNKVSEPAGVYHRPKKSVPRFDINKQSLPGKNPADFAAITKNDHDYMYGDWAVLEKANKAEWQLTPVEKMNIARNGLSKKDLERLKAKTKLDYDKLSAILATTRATLINKKGEALFNATLSEKIVSVADVYSYGFEVFENENRFNEWIFKSNQALGGKQPFELLDNQFGREEVKNLIGRIDYGVYS